MSGLGNTIIPLLIEGDLTREVSLNVLEEILEDSLRKASSFLSRQWLNEQMF